MEHSSEQKLWKDTLELVGKKVEVSTHSQPTPMRGTVVNAMFDSFILETENSERQIVAYRDLRFLDEL